MKKLLSILLCLPFIGFGQNLYIPDTNFKAYLVGNMAININGDSEIQFSEASVFNGTINCGSLQISNLTGIEFFTSLIGLYCMDNQIDSINLSQNIALTNLDCGYNQLISLDVSNCKSLELLRCQGNYITILDLKNQVNLSELYCNNNQLYSLDIRNCFNFLFSLNQTLSEYDSRNNPNLTCINVDDSIFSTTNWLNIDNQQYFTSSCNSLVSWVCVNNSCSISQTVSGDYNSLCECESACSITQALECVDSLGVTDVIIDNDALTMDIAIYNGYNYFLSYPYVAFTIDANGDTIQQGNLNLFVAFDLDTTEYNYPINSAINPSYPLTMYFVYTGGSFASDTCILTYNSAPTDISDINPISNRKLISIFDVLGRESKGARNEPFFYIYDDGTVEKRITID